MNVKLIVSKIMTIKDMDIEKNVMKIVQKEQKNQKNTIMFVKT